MQTDYTPADIAYLKKFECPDDGAKMEAKPGCYRCTLCDFSITVGLYRDIIK